VSNELMFSGYPPFDYAAPSARGSAQGEESAEIYCSINLEKYNCPAHVTADISNAEAQRRKDSINLCGFAPWRFAGGVTPVF
jgi:hypothetical protein